MFWFSAACKAKQTGSLHIHQGNQHLNSAQQTRIRQVRQLLEDDVKRQKSVKQQPAECFRVFRVLAGCAPVSIEG